MLNRDAAKAAISKIVSTFFWDVIPSALCLVFLFVAQPQHWAFYVSVFVVCSIVVTLLNFVLHYRRAVRAESDRRLNFK